MPSIDLIAALLCVLSWSLIAALNLTDWKL